MKRRLTYEQMSALCDKVSRVLITSVSPNYSDVRLVAISRGGLTAGHRIAYNLNKPLDFFIPSRKLLTIDREVSEETVLIFLEDVVAKGRTYFELRHFIAEQSYLNICDWLFVPLVLDQKFVDEHGVPPEMELHGTIESDWIVFPHETMDNVVENDHGLFRDGTGVSSKLIGETDGA